MRILRARRYQAAPVASEHASVAARRQASAQQLELARSELRVRSEPDDLAQVLEHLCEEGVDVGVLVYLQSP